jgi:hypothetical protein
MYLRNVVAVILISLGVGLLGFAPAAAASGSGYNLAYVEAPSPGNGHIDLIRVVTVDLGGPNISVMFQVNGTVLLNSTTYGYNIDFGVHSGSNPPPPTAWVTLSNNTSDAFLHTALDWSPNSPIPIIVSAGGSAVSLSIAKSVVGPSSVFSVVVEAQQEGPGGANILGTGFQCGWAPCTTSNPGFWGYVGASLGIIFIGIGVATLAGILVMLMNRRTPPPLDSIDRTPPKMPPPSTGPPRP